jgi:EF hand
MRLLLTTGAFVAVLLLAVSFAEAQPGGKKGGKGSTETADEFIKKLMVFNKAKDGKLTKEELIDKRLHALFDRADTNKDGVVTREELEVLFAREKLEGGGFGGDKGKGGFDKKGKGPKGGPPQPGQVLPSFLQDALNLTADQRKQLADLQKDVDARLATILTDEQRAQLREMGNKGPKGPKGPPPDKD